MRLQSSSGPTISQVFPKLKVYSNKKLERKIDHWAPVKSHLQLNPEKRLCYNTCFLRTSSQDPDPLRGDAVLGSVVAHCCWSRGAQQVRTPVHAHVETHSFNSREDIPFGKETGHSCLQPNVHFIKKVYHKGIIKIPGTGWFSVSQASRKHNVVMEKGNQATLDFFQKQC